MQGCSETLSVNTSWWLGTPAYVPTQRRMCDKKVVGKGSRFRHFILHKDKGGKVR